MTTDSDLPPPRAVSGESLLEDVLIGELADVSKYDRDIIQLLRKHLSGTSIRSRAGQELGDDLVTLAKKRASDAGSR